jgi:ABC-2 type transport system permease protein
VKPYTALLRARFLALLQYRAAAFAGLVTQVFWGFVRIMIFAAFFESSRRAQPMSYEEVVTYVWLGQAMLMILPFRLDPEAQALVETGNVAYELLRPVDLYGFWFARSVALRTAPTLLRAAPMLLLAIPFFGMGPPADLSSFGAFLASVAAGFLVGAAITTLMSISLLWTISGRGIARILAIAPWIFSGIIIPLPFFPDWAQPLLDALPFRALMDTPFRLYLGHIPATGVGRALLHQVGWLIGLVLLGRWLLARAKRRLVVQGG